MGTMEKMMEECSPGMTADEKNKMMGEMMPKVIMAMMGGREGEAGMEGMMAQMKSACGGEGGMSALMTEMMPHCLKMMLPTMPTEDRVTFARHLARILVEASSSDMSEEEKAEFITVLVEELRT